jgi:hypothetical protein
MALGRKKTKNTIYNLEAEIFAVENIKLRILPSSKGLTPI